MVVDTPVRPAPPSKGDRPPGRQRRRLSTRARILAAVGVGVGVVIVSLLILLTASETTPCPPPGAGTTASPSTGAVKSNEALFQDNFSNRAGGWEDAGSEPVGGHYTNGAYRICFEPVSGGGFEASAPQKASSVYPSAPRNLRIEVEARRLAGDSDTGYGIACRAGANSYQFLIGDGISRSRSLSTMILITRL